MGWFLGLVASLTVLALAWGKFSANSSSAVAGMVDETWPSERRKLEENAQATPTFKEKFWLVASLFWMTLSGVFALLCTSQLLAFKYPFLSIW